MTLLLTSISAFTLSLIAKVASEVWLTERIPIVGAHVGLELVRNSGIAFGLKLPQHLQTLLISFALILVFFLAFKSRLQRLPSFCFGLILGGALANIVDRFADGLVTDFIQIGFWPSFNIADSCITLGVSLLLVLEVFQKGKQGGQ